ncbi:MAG: siphovirus Gp157 family protein [Lachnospiraceae bacterium]|nr:siphovirus Gp157 family protein [Lachnospiraceae bacterium]
MGESLYELTEKWAIAKDMFYDDEVDDQVIFDTLEAIEGEIEDKADKYAIILRTMAGDIETIRKEEARLYARRASLERRSKALKERLQANLEFVGKTKFRTALFSFSIAKNGGKQPIEITSNMDEIPGKYLIPQPPIPDKEAIRELLKDKEVDWAQLLPYGKHLTIR